MNRLAWALLAALTACGGFWNTPLEPPDVPPVDTLQPVDVPPLEVELPCPEPLPLQPRVDGLPDVRAGEAYVQPLTLAAWPDVALSWTLEEGALPPGLFLDARGGLLHGRAAADGVGTHPFVVGVAPLGGGACVTAGRSDPATLTVLEPCDGGGPSCTPPLACIDGRCQLAGARCPLGGGERVVLGVSDKGRGVHRVTRARVLANTRDADPAATVRYGLLELDDAERQGVQSLTYRLPADLLLPLEPDQVITLATYFDELGTTALAAADAEGQPLFFAYDGPLTGAAFVSVCKSLGACPLQDLASLLSDCPPQPTADGGTEGPATLSLLAASGPALASAGDAVLLGDATVARVAYVGQARQLVTFPPEGPASATVWHAFVVQRADACPSPFIALTTAAADDGAMVLRLDGTRSRSLAGAVAAWEWSVQQPDGNDGAPIEEEGSGGAVVTVAARVPGFYGARLEVVDAAGVRSCVADFVTWWRDGPAAR